MYDQFEMMHGKFKQSITKEFYYKNSFSFHFAFNREQASFLSKTIFQSRACKIFCLLLSTMMTMNTIKEQLYSGSLLWNIMNYEYNIISAIWIISQICIFQLRRVVIHLCYWAKRFITKTHEHSGSTRIRYFLI